MFRVIFRVERIPEHVGPQFADDITEGFQHRPWHSKATCVYERGGLTFTSENDFDSDGLATQDELSDEISANMPVLEEDDGNLTLVSVESLGVGNLGG